MSDSFGNPVFKESFKKFFELDELGNLKMGFLASSKIFVSPEFKVCGAIGHCSSKKNKTAAVSETEIGVGGTVEWYLGGIDHNKSLAIYFDVTKEKPVPNVAHPPLFI
jgi:protein transport protein SEC23